MPAPQPPKQQPKWKQELVIEHKFDHVRLTDFHTTAWWPRMRYSFIYLMILRLFFLYVADLITIVFYFRGTTGSTIPIDLPASYLGGIYLFCFLSSNLIFWFEAKKSKRIIESRDISFTFTNTIAYRYYCLKDYLYFCFFDQISKMKSQKDGIALFVFMRLRGWKRLVFAETPRNAINIYTLARIAMNARSINPAKWLTESILYDTALVIIMISTAIFFVSILSSFIAIWIYFPLICSIKGNLKEYICHKIDKRIAELMASHGLKRRNNQRGDSPGPQYPGSDRSQGGSLPRDKDASFHNAMQQQQQQREPHTLPHSTHQQSQRSHSPAYLHSEPPLIQRNHGGAQNFIRPGRSLTDTDNAQLLDERKRLISPNKFEDSLKVNRSANGPLNSDLAGRASPPRKLAGNGYYQSPNMFYQASAVRSTGRSSPQITPLPSPPSSLSRTPNDSEANASNHPTVYARQMSSSGRPSQDKPHSQRNYDGSSWEGSRTEFRSFDRF